MSKLFRLYGLEQFGCPVEFYILAEDAIEVPSKLKKYFENNSPRNTLIVNMEVCKELIEHKKLEECEDVVLVDMDG